MIGKRIVNSVLFCIIIFTPSFDTLLLSAYLVPDPVLESGNTPVNKGDKNALPQEA